MRRFIKLSGGFALGLVIAICTATSAHAAAPVPFTITEQVNFATGFNTFTATGPLCPSGTFVDDVTTFAPNPSSSVIGASGGFNLVIHTVYTCDDGSGTFNALKELIGTISGPDTVTATGPIQLLRGTGAFTDLRGHGVDTGSIDFAAGTATGTDTGVVVRS